MLSRIEQNRRVKNRTRKDKTWRCCLNSLGNTYWLSNRRIAQRVAVQELPSFSTPGLARKLSAVAVREWLELIPSWAILGMILLATLGICSTVIVRTRAQLRISSQQYEHLASEIDSLGHGNAYLQNEIGRMTADPGTIESAARERLGMVKPSDIVVPIESTPSTSNFGTLSFVR